MTRPSTTATQARSKRARTDREGAVMIVVMLVLLAATAAGVYASHSSVAELRSAGSVRQIMQAQYVAEAGLTSALALVDTIGPAALLHSIHETTQRALRPNLLPYEPAYSAMQEGYRMFDADVGLFSGGSPMQPAILGPTGNIYTPSFVVDINDAHTYTGVIAGQRSDGYGRLQYLQATYTSRGRLFVTAGDVTLAGDARRYHEAANDARARGLSGPFGR